jgi:hypothetical protein
MVRIPDWKRFLGVDVNKQALLAFLGGYTTRHYSELGDMPYPGDSLFIAGLFQAILCIKLTQTCYIYHGHVGSVDSLWSW